MPEPLGIAVLGAGRWGIHLIRNFLKHPDAQLLAVADPHADRLEMLTRTLAVDVDVVLTTDWREILKLEGVQGVAIATPASTHFELAQAVLTHNLHVLIEKPLTLNYRDSLMLCQLAKQHQRQLVVDHTYLFHPAVHRGKEAIASGLLGDLRYGYAARTHLGPVRQDVDALWDLAIHDIAIFNYWLGQTPIRVQAHGTSWLQHSALKSGSFSDSLSDLVWLTLTYPAGFQASIHLCWCNPDKQRRLCFVGDRGTLIFDELASSPLTLQTGWIDSSSGTHTPVYQAMQHLSVPKIEPLYEVCSHFLICVQHNLPSSISSGQTGTQLVQILQALTQSLHQQGKVIELAV
jgi:predicted dehydrogenase